MPASPSGAGRDGVRSLYGYATPLDLPAGGTRATVRLRPQSS